MCTSQSCLGPCAQNRVDSYRRLQPDTEARFDQAEVITRMGGLLFPQGPMNHLLVLRSSDPGRGHEYSKAMGILLKDFVHRITGRNQAGLARSRVRSEM